MHVRRYMLSLFLAKECIKRSEVNFVAKMDGIMLTNMIAEIAYRVKGGWVLKCAPDESFCEQYELSSFF